MKSVGKRWTAIAISLLVATLLAHGLESSPAHLESPGHSRYERVFLTAFNGYVRVWERVTFKDFKGDIERLSESYSSFVVGGSSVLGFGIFWAVSGIRLGWNVWKPLLIAYSAALSPLKFIGPTPYSTMALAVIALLIMLVSVGWRPERPPHADGPPHF